MKTIKIELRTSHDDTSRDDIITAAAKMAAKHLYTQALLVSEKRKPQIAIYSSDMFLGWEEISLADDIPQDEQTTTEGDQE